MYIVPEIRFDARLGYKCIKMYFAKNQRRPCHHSVHTNIDQADYKIEGHAIIGMIKIKAYFSG
jgi:hypothetical protein